METTQDKILAVADDKTVTKSVKKQKKMVLLEHHIYQWGETESFPLYLCEMVLLIIMTPMRKEEKENKLAEVKNLFLHQKVSCMEKFNGTNIAIDRQGQVYTRRCKLPEEDVEFNKTDITHVRNQREKVESLETYITKEMETADLKFGNILVYGELMCPAQNKFEEYDYEERNLKGKWVIFGCTIQVTNKDTRHEIETKLRNLGYAAKGREGTDKADQIKIFMNEKLKQILKDSPLTANTLSWKKTQCTI